MKHYIGIRGHRGSGKYTISYLLGKTIDLVLRNKRLDNIALREMYDGLYAKWSEEIINDPEAPVESVFVYLDSFGDTPKMLISMIAGIPTHYLYSDYYKDHCVVHLKDFTYTVYDDITEEIAKSEHLYRADEGILQVCTMKSIGDISMTLREFIIYYATVTSNFLGKDVWVKSKVADDRRSQLFDNMYNDGSYRIFVDLKAPTEVSYIKDRDGIVIKVERPSNIKADRGVDSLTDDDRIDYSITFNNLEDLKDKIWNIVESLNIKE